MLTKLILILTALFLRRAVSSPYPLPNSTSPATRTICNDTLCIASSNLTTASPQALNTSRQNICREVYPADITVLNSRYPDYDTDHLHKATQFFMLRRQLLGDGEIATHVQFQDLPSNTSNLTCRLEFVLPRPELQLLQGFNPSFNVYQVAREAGSTATWDTYEGNNVDNVTLFGTVNGEAQALELTRSVGGVAAVNETNCNHTPSFQMGIKYDGLAVPNFWEFLNVAPPAWPVQGFRMMYGC